MKGMTLWTISAPGCFGVQAKWAIDFAVLVGQIEDVIAGGDDLLADLAQVAQLQARRDFRQYLLVDEFHAQHERRRFVRGLGLVVGRDDRHGRDDGGAAKERLQSGQRDAGWLFRRGIAAAARRGRAAGR